MDSGLLAALGPGMTGINVADLITIFTDTFATTGWLEARTEARKIASTSA
jgi:hypothetical protein